MASSTDRQLFREVLATLAAQTKTKIPELNGRVEKAVKLALAGDVELHADGTATVYSSSDPTRRYEIRQGTCTCRDYEQAPEHLCQHRLSAGLMRRTTQLMQAAPVPVDPETVPEAWPDNDPEEPAAPVPCPAPLPEAPCSVNCHIVVAGRQVQVTLRGHEEGAVLTRLEAVLQRYPIPQPAPQAASPAEGFCQKHGVQMKENHKENRTWFSHYDEAAGRWCKGK